MRRHAEIALHAVEGALQVLQAARQAAREALAVAMDLRIAPRDAEAIRAAAAAHLLSVEQALLPLELARRGAEALKTAVEQAEISRFAIPVLPVRAGA